MSLLLSLLQTVHSECNAGSLYMYNGYNLTKLYCSSASVPLFFFFFLLSLFLQYFRLTITNAAFSFYLTSWKLNISEVCMNAAWRRLWWLITLSGNRSGSGQKRGDPRDFYTEASEIPTPNIWKSRRNSVKLLLDFVSSCNFTTIWTRPLF